MYPTPAEPASPRIRVPGVLLALVLVVIWVTGCTETRNFHADYPGYPDVTTLFSRANLVVEAKVGSGEVKELQISKETGEKAVYTVFDVTVEHVFKGSAREGQVVPVKQAGGTLGGIRYVEDGAVFLESGTTVILFLETYADSPASLLNPAQGQYPVDEAGTVTSLEGNPIRFSKADLQRLSAGPG